MGNVPTASEATAAATIVVMPVETMAQRPSVVSSAARAEVRRAGHGDVV